jgi:hypothetical protein
MKKFMVLYHAPAEVVQQTLLHNRDDSEKGMQAWVLWAQRCGEKLVDLGWPLMNGQELTTNGEIRNSKKDVTGYSIPQADNIEDARALLKDHPHLAWNPACSIEVHETIPLPQM